MTSASEQRPSNMAMTSATRASRFPNFTMGTGNGANDKPPTTIGSSFSSAGWPSGRVWGNGSIGFPKREMSGSRESNESFAANAPTGSGALAATSEAEPWRGRNGPWNHGESSQARPTSGSASPGHARDASQSFHDGSFFASPQPVIGPRTGSFSSRPKPNSVLDPSTGPFKFGGSFTPFHEDEQETSPFSGRKFESGPSARAYGPERRTSQDPPYLNGVSGLPRDHSLPSSSHGEPQHPPSNPVFQPFQPFGTDPAASHRPGLPTHTSSFPLQTNTRGFGQSDYAAEGDLATEFSRALSLEGPAGGSPSRNGTAPSYSPFSAPNMGYNPASQPWDSAKRLDQLAGPSSQAYQAVAKLGSMPDRASLSAGQVYRSGPATPRSHGDTPPALDPWGVPASRDSRTGSDLERRGPNQGFPQQQQPFLSSPYYHGAFPSQYPPPVYETYAAQQGYRPQMQMLGYGYSYMGAPPSRSSRDSDAGKNVRSMLLEEFRSSSRSTKRYELKDIYNHFVEFSGDQHGSRFIQQKLETANSDEKDQIFREIHPNALQLMKDVFGNYVIQKFFEHGNQVQKKLLAEVMKGKVADLAMQMYACRVVQKALEHVLVEQQAELVRELEPDVLRVVKDQNGNHVVQKVIELVPRPSIGFIMDSFRGRMSELASHTYGCRVVQRMLEYGSEGDKVTIMEELHAHAQFLVTDQYGNYVIQHVIAQGDAKDRSRIIQLVTSQLLTLSKHKFASNVVEKCIEYGNAEERRRIRDEITAAGSDGNNALQIMMRDQYGNYVIQKLLQQLDGPEREAFVDEMRPQFIALKRVSTGRQIAAIDRLISAASMPGPSRTDASSGIAAPTSPAAHADTPSTAPTPVLTMEPNSPQSSSPPSTDASAAGDAVVENGAVESKKVAPSEVQVADS